MKIIKWSFAIVICTVAIRAFVLFGLEHEFSTAEWTASIQAFGSLAALGIAIFVMHGQSNAAMKLVADSDIKALRRRAESVAVLIDYAVGRMEYSEELITDAFRGHDPHAMEMVLKVCSDELSEVKRVLVAIPAHELGSYGLTRALQLTISSVDSTLKTIVPEDWQSLHGSLDSFIEALEIQVTGVRVQAAAFEASLLRLT